MPEEFKTGMFEQERTISLPPGFSISLFSIGLPNARFMAEDKDGNIYVSLSKGGKIVVLSDKNKDGFADSQIVFADDLDRPHGLLWINGQILVAEVSRLTVLQDTDGDLKADKREVLSSDLPDWAGHWTRSLALGLDNGIFISNGSSCNACRERDEKRAAVLKLTGNKTEIFATGLRNTVGIEFHPETNELWGVDNGTDHLGEDIPPEELNLIKKGNNYGWPDCYGDRVPDVKFGSKEACSNTTPPHVLMQAHSAPLGVAFGHRLKFPDEYKNAFYIAFHGSWNREVPTGYKIVYIKFEGGRPVGKAVDFATGWLGKGGPWGRPVDVLASTDGSLYLSDDLAGVVYRIKKD